MTPPDDDALDSDAAPSGGEPGPERLRSSGSNVARLLLRSAEVDVPPLLERERARTAVERLLDAPRTDAPRPRLDLAIAGLGGAVAALLGVWLWPAPAAGPTFTWQPGPAARAPSPDVSSSPTQPTSEAAPSGAAAPSTLSPAAATPSLPVALSPCPRVSVGRGSELLIDDFEDGNARLLVAGGRSGTWKASGDGTGQQAPISGQLAFPTRLSEPGRASRFVLRLHAERMTGGGAGLSVDLAPGRCYDASAYAGIELHARGTGRVYVSAMMVDMMEKKWGGLCERDCYDQHTAPLDLARAWQRFELRWSELEQGGWGRRVELDPTRLLAIGVSAQSADTPIDFEIDDVRFIAR